MTKICKKYLDDVKPYNTKLLIGIAILFILMGFVLMSTYRLPIIRYSIIVILGCIMIINRKIIKEKVNILIQLKK